MPGIAKAPVRSHIPSQLWSPKWDQTLFETYRFTIVKHDIWAQSMNQEITLWGRRVTWSEQFQRKVLSLKSIKKGTCLKRCF